MTANTAAQTISFTAFCLAGAVIATFNACRPIIPYEDAPDVLIIEVIQEAPSGLQVAKEELLDQLQEKQTWE